MCTGSRRSSASPPLALVAAFILAVTACASGNAERARGAAEPDLRGELAALQKGQVAQAREMARLAEQMKAIDAQQAFLVAEALKAKEELARVQSAVRGHAAFEQARAAPVSTPGAEDRASSPSTSRETSADQVFAVSMATFRAEKYGQAALEFGELTHRFPQHALASTAQYWIGEARYRERDYQQAVVEFLKVVDRYPQSPQVPEALLKIGLCYQGLEDVARARESWERLTKDYPATSAGREARSLLAQLGGAPPRAR